MRIVLAVLLLAAAEAVAQSVSRHEVAVGIGFNTNTANAEYQFIQDYQHPQRFGLLAPQLRYSLNLSRHLALEGSVAPSIYRQTDSLREGGRQTLVLGGLKSGIRRGRLGLFGTSRAGAASFDCGEHELYPEDRCTRETHFALEQGAAVEWNLSARTLLRVDVAELLLAEFPRTYQRDSNGFAVVTSGNGVPHHGVLAVSAAYRFGRLQSLPSAREAEATREQRGFSVGGLYGAGIEQHLLLYNTRADGGGGAWLGFPLLPGRAGRYLSADLVAFDQPHDDHTADVQDGGTTFRAFLGPKLGVRRGPVGIYAKARPGIMRFSRTDVLDVATASGVHSYTHPKVDFALDTGLVLEYTPAAHALRHAVLRFEGGSTYIHYHGATVTVVDAPRFGVTTVQTYYAEPQRHTSLLFLSGVGFRF